MKLVEQPYRDDDTDKGVQIMETIRASLKSAINEHCWMEFLSFHYVPEKSGAFAKTIHIHEVSD